MTRASLDLLYNVSRELAAALDLPTLLERVLSLSVQHVGAITGSIIVLDAHEQPLESALIVRDRLYENTTRQLRVTLEQGLAGWVARTRQAVLVPNTSRDPRWVRRPDDAVDQTGPKSAVSAPILARDHLVGVITLVHSTPEFFTEEHLALVQALADQAGIAILNARLYAESQRQARVMTAVAESTAVIAASLKLEDVLARILDQISQALRVEAVFLALIDPQDKTLALTAASPPTPYASTLHWQLGDGLAGWVAQTGEGEIIPDVSKDPRYLPEVGYALEITPRALACAPVRSLGQVIGVVEALNPIDGAFDQDALLVLTGIGGMAGTAIRHAQLYESLDAAHQRYRELFEDSIDPILVTDWRGQILEANRQAELTIGLKPADLRRLTIDSLGVVDSERLGPDFHALTDDEMVSYESVLVGSPGLPTPVQVYARQVRVDGQPFLQWILRDISERKKLDSLRDDLISMIYHDLRSPLTNVVSSLDVLGAAVTAQNEPAFRSLLNIAVRSTERIQRLTNSLLDINRLEAGQAIVNRQQVEIAELFEEALDAVQPLAANKDQSLETDLPPGLPGVLVDSDMIRRVLINLMENAIKFSPTAGTVTVGAAAEPDCLRVWVSDTGPGIPAAEQERIFDKFTRLKVKEGPRGLGLGLAFCRLAILGHGGRIWVEPAPHTGARFVFTLPRLDTGAVGREHAASGS